MLTFKNLLSIVFSQVVIEKIVAFVALIFIGWMLRDFLALFFITFLFAYIFLELGELLANKIHTWGGKGKQDSLHKIAIKYSTTNNLVSILYVVFI